MTQDQLNSVLYHAMWDARYYGLNWEQAYAEAKQRLTREPAVTRTKYVHDIDE